MDRETIIALNAMNAEFYRANKASFSHSRQDAWPGWNRIAEHLLQVIAGRNLDVLDVACGNMRFEKYLTESLPDIKLEATCIDSCDDLAIEHENCIYRHIDIVEELCQGDSLARAWGSGYDLVVSFGFFHHVPSSELRLRLLEALIESARPGGLIAFSLWRFASNSKMLAKARRTTEEALSTFEEPPKLEEGDYLLGWNNVPGAFRYCHSFSDREIDSLAASASQADLIDRFRADGRTNALNEYLVFRKR